MVDTPSPSLAFVPAETIDGMQVWTVREAAGRAVEHARSGSGPFFLEAITYRYVGHSRSDPGKYRPKEEVDEWLGRDPIPRLASSLDEATVDEIAQRLESELEAALDAARSAPVQSGNPSTAYKGA